MRPDKRTQKNLLQSAIYDGGDQWPQQDQARKQTSVQEKMVELPGFSAVEPRAKADETDV